MPDSRRALWSRGLCPGVCGGSSLWGRLSPSELLSLFQEPM